MTGPQDPAAAGAGRLRAGHADREQVIETLKDAFAHAHKAVATINNSNLLEQTTDPFNPKGKRTRVDSVGIFYWHTYDHYGQMVEYLRMNGLVPPASR